MDKNSDMSDEKSSALNKDISNFLKRLAPKELHTYIDDKQTETDIKIIPIEEHQKTKNLIQKSTIVNCTIIHPQLKDPLIFSSYTQVTQSELELLKPLIQQPITTRQLTPLGLLGSKSSNSSSSSKLQISTQLTSPSRTKQKLTLVSSTEPSTTSISNSIQTSSIVQSTQSASSSIITNSNLKEPVVRPKIPSTKQGENKNTSDKPQIPVTASKKSILSPNLQLLTDLGLQKIKEIYEEGQNTLDMLLQTIKALHKEGQADKELTEKYRNMLEQQVKLAKFIKEKEEEQIEQIVKKHESFQKLLENPMLEKHISCSTNANQTFLTTTQKATTYSSPTPFEETPIPSSKPEPINFELLSLPVDKLSQLDLTILKNIFEPVENKRRILEKQIRQQVKEGKQVDSSLQQEHQYLISLQIGVLMATKNFLEEKLSQLPSTSGLAYRLQEAKAITQVLKKKTPSFPKDGDSKSIQFIILDNVHNTKNKTSKTTGRANQQVIQSTNTSEKIKKKGLITTLDKSSSLPETGIEPLHSSEQQPSSNSHHKQKKKQTQTPTPSSNQSLPSISTNSPSPSIESISQQIQPKSIETKKTVQNECTPDIPREKKEKKKHLKHTPKKPSSSILTHPEKEKPSTSNKDSTIPYPTQNRPVFEEVKIPDTPKKKTKKKKKPGFGRLVGDSLFSEEKTASISETTSTQTPSGFTEQEYKDEKEALKNCPLSPPDEFSDDENTTEKTGTLYISKIFSGNDLNIKTPIDQRTPVKPLFFAYNPQKNEYEEIKPNISLNTTPYTDINPYDDPDLDIYTSPYDDPDLDIYTSPIGEGNNKESQESPPANEEPLETAGNSKEPQRAVDEIKEPHQSTDDLKVASSRQNTSQHPDITQSPAQFTPSQGNIRKPRKQRTGQTQILTKRLPSTSSLVTELLSEGQVSSLQSLQFALSDTSEFISETLKSLALKAHSSSKHLSTTTDKKSQLRSSNRKTSGSFNKTTSTIENTNIIEALQPTKPYTVFTSMNRYTTNLENKLRSARAGIMLNLSPKINIGLAYNCNRKEYKEYSGAQINSNSGSVKSKSTNDGLAAIFTLNPKKKGITGTMIGLYSWGKVTNSRRSTHGEKHIVTKGSSDITLTGGLVQLGYNIPTIKTLILTPYVECLFSSVKWSPYTEKQSLITYKISENRENLLEKSVGLKTKGELTEHSQLHTWIVGSSGLKKTNSLSSNSMITPLSKYTISVPSYKKKYIKVEGGLSYETQLSPTLTLGLDGILSFEKIKKIEKKQHISLHFNYYY